MQVSIIIPSLNSPIIDQVITQLQQQTAWTQIGEIIIVGKDNLKLVREDNIVCIIDTEQPVSAPTARNIGIKASQSDILIFLDSDCLPQSDWLEQIIKAQSAGHLVVSGGVLPKGTNYWSLTYNLTMFHEFSTTLLPGKRNYLPTLNLSVNRQVIEKIGLLNENLDRGQDIEWTARMASAGYIPYFWPNAAIFHHHNRQTYRDVLKDCARSGYHMRQIRLKNPKQLQAPIFLRSKFLILLFSPVIALWAMLRALWKRPSLFLKNWHTLPAIFLTKLAWCWGASRPHKI